jgi:homoserine kinase
MSIVSRDENLSLQGTTPLLFVSDDRHCPCPTMKLSPRSAVGEAFCSSANLGAGFDVFGLALAKYSDKVGIRLTSGKKIRLFIKGTLGRNIPRQLGKNSAGPPAIAMLRKTGLRTGLEITIEKKVPQGLGLGSSGATAAACTKALDYLLGLNLSTDELVRIASLGEKAVAGTAHADNVAASLLGGFSIVYGSPVKAISLKPPPNLIAVVASPQMAVKREKTRNARRIIPSKVGLAEAILNIGRASAIVAGFAKSDIGMIGTGMEDEIAEPYRESLIPGFAKVRRAALEAGAAGVSISGAGPSAIAIVDRKNHDPRIVGRAMRKGFAENNVSSTWFAATPAPSATIIEAN